MNPQQIYTDFSKKACLWQPKRNPKHFAGYQVVQKKHGDDFFGRQTMHARRKQPSPMNQQTSKPSKSPDETTMNMFELQPSLAREPITRLPLTSPKWCEKNIIFHQSKSNQNNTNHSATSSKPHEVCQDGLVAVGAPKKQTKKMMKFWGLLGKIAASLRINGSGTFKKVTPNEKRITHLPFKP